MKKNIILTGYMGCGKSTIGKKLSYLLRMPYIDTDKLIETAQKKSISDIFAEQGEKAFRDMETECLKGLFANKLSYIISVGGGTPLREENRELMRKLGTVVYLRAKPETIYDRLKYDTTRPLLQTKDPQARIREMLMERNPIYESVCHSIVDVDNKDFETILKEIKEASKR